MSQPLLEVKGLTVRFRGLTAVDKVDLEVSPGEIFAIIGPNGAGKTTVFNAVTGIYEPSAGVVRLDGADLRKQARPGDYVRWGLSGLLVGILFLFFIADIDHMWAAVIKQNYRGRGSFPIGQAWQDFRRYMAGDPHLEQRAGRFQVVSFDGKHQFDSARTREEAEARLDAIVALGRGAAPATPWWTPDEARQKQVLAARMVREAAAARQKRWLAFVLGLLLGTAGAWAVWRQTRRTPASVALRGIARTFQNIRLFQDMTVLENVLVGMDRHLVAPEGRTLGRRAVDMAPLAGLVGLLIGLSLSLRWAVLPNALNLVLLILFLVGTGAWLARMAMIGAFRGRDVRTEATARAEARRLLAFVGLEAKAEELSRNLAYGNQRRLEIARALATRPRLLLLDEPAAGMNPAETGSLMKLIKKIRDEGTTVLLIEHHMRVVMGISDRIAVLVYGKKIAEGSPEAIRANPEVIEAYLGKESLG